MASDLTLIRYLALPLPAAAAGAADPEDWADANDWPIYESPVTLVVTGYDAPHGGGLHEPPDAGGFEFGAYEPELDGHPHKDAYINAVNEALSRLGYYDSQRLQDEAAALVEEKYGD